MNEVSSSSGRVGRSLLACLRFFHDIRHVPIKRTFPSTLCQPTVDPNLLTWCWGRLQGPDEGAIRFNSYHHYIGNILPALTKVIVLLLPESFDRPALLDQNRPKHVYATLPEWGLIYGGTTAVVHCLVSSDSSTKNPVWLPDDGQDVVYGSHPAISQSRDSIVGRDVW